MVNEKVRMDEDVTVVIGHKNGKKTTISTNTKKKSIWQKLFK